MARIKLLVSRLKTENGWLRVPLHLLAVKHGFDIEDKKEQERYFSTNGQLIATIRIDPRSSKRASQATQAMAIQTLESYARPPPSPSRTHRSPMTSTSEQQRGPKQSSSGAIRGPSGTTPLTKRGLRSSLAPSPQCRTSSTNCAAWPDLATSTGGFSPEFYGRLTCPKKSARPSFKQSDAQSHSDSIPAPAVRTNRRVGPHHGHRGRRYSRCGTAATAPSTPSRGGNSTTFRLEIREPHAPGAQPLPAAIPSRGSYRSAQEHSWPWSPNALAPS